MTDYNKYVLAVNKIFEVLGKIKPNYTDSDNKTYISDLEEYKDVIIKSASRFSNEKTDSTNMTKQSNMTEMTNVEEEI